MQVTFETCLIARSFVKLQSFDIRGKSQMIAWTTYFNFLISSTMVIDKIT